MGKLLDDLKNKFGGDAKIPDSSAGGTVSPEMANNRNPALDAARADVTAEVQKRKRGRPPNAGGGVAGAAPSVSADQAALAKIQEGLERLYRPEAWKPLVCLPANAALAFTGNKHWELGSDEKENLAQTVSIAAQYMAIQNPRSLALSLAALAIITVYAPRIIKEASIRRDKKTDKEKPAEK